MTSSTARSLTHQISLYKALCRNGLRGSTRTEYRARKREALLMQNGLVAMRCRKSPGQGVLEEAEAILKTSQS